MASIATHYLFSEEVDSHLPSQIREIISRNHGAYHMGAQGPDLFFYDILHLAITNKQNNIGTLMHVKKTDTFFAHMLDQVSKTSSDCALAYLFGMLTHYCLDSTIHPYIYSKTTLPDTTTNAKSRSLAAHCQMESDIDELLFNDYYNEPICSRNRAEFIDITKSEAQNVSPVLADAINQTYGCQLSASYVRGTIARAKWTNARLQDNSGWKKKHLSALEHKVTGSSVGTSLIFHQKLPDRCCLNEDHRIWRVPATGRIHTDSVSELFDQALIRATTLIIESAHAFHNLKAYPNDSDKKERIKICRQFAHKTGGLSYHTGQKWRLGD